MEYESGVCTKEELLRIAQKYGLNDDPIYLSNLNRYLQLQSLQKMFYEISSKRSAELPTYLDIAKEANACAKLLRQRQEEVAGASLKYSETAKRLVEAAKRDYEKQLKDVKLEHESKLRVEQRQYEREKRVYENKMFDLNRQLEDRMSVYKNTVLKVNEEILNTKREKEIALQDLKEAKKEVEAAKKESQRAKDELEALKEKLRTTKKSLDSTERALASTEKKVVNAENKLKKVLETPKPAKPVPKPQKPEVEPVDPDGL